MRLSKAKVRLTMVTAASTGALLVPLSWVLFAPDDEPGAVPAIRNVQGPFEAGVAPLAAVPAPIPLLPPAALPGAPPLALETTAEAAPAQATIFGPAEVRPGAETAGRSSTGDDPLGFIPGYDAPPPAPEPARGEDAGAPPARQDRANDPAAGSGGALAAVTSASDPAPTATSLSFVGPTAPALCRSRIFQPRPRVPGVRAKDAGRPATTVTTCDDAVEVASPAHRARFTASGLSITPSDATGAQEAATLRYRLDRVARSQNVLFSGGEQAPQVEANHVQYPRGSFVEHYMAFDRGVEQFFSFEEVPAGQGDLVIRGRVETDLRGRVRADGSVCFEGSGGCGVVFGHARAFDGLGRSVDLALVLDDDSLEIRVPGEWLRNAAGPLLVDPLIGADTQLTSFVDDEEQVDIAYNASTNCDPHRNDQREPGLRR